MALKRFGMLASAALAAGLLVSTQASAVDLVFEDLVYLSCQDVHEMSAADRQAVGEYLAERSADRHGVAWPLENDLGDDTGFLVVGACTMNPDAYLFAVIDRAIVATFVE
jgi:hypothetical protein